MGYTHYWTASQQLDPLPEKAVKDIQAIFDKCADIIAFEEDEPDKPPLVTPELITFNGREGCETFVFDLSKGFNFCKTARLPYDDVVVAVLIVLKSNYGELLDVSSDGCGDEWDEGIALAKEFGYTLALCSK